MFVRISGPRSCLRLIRRRGLRLQAACAVVHLLVPGELLGPDAGRVAVDDRLEARVDRASAAVLVEHRDGLVGADLGEALDQRVTLVVEAGGREHLVLDQGRAAAGTRCGVGARLSGRGRGLSLHDLGSLGLGLGRRRRGGRGGLLLVIRATELRLIVLDRRLSLGLWRGLSGGLRGLGDGLSDGLRGLGGCDAALVGLALA